MKFEFLKSRIMVLSITTLSAASVGRAEELPNIDQTQISILDAIHIAEKSVTDSSAIEVEADSEDGKPVFEVEVIKNGASTEITIDAKSGKIIESNSENFISKLFSSEESREREALKKAQVSLSKTIQILQDKMAGNIKKAELKVEGQMTFYEISMIISGKEVEFNVDTVTGDISNKIHGNDKNHLEEDDHDD